MEPPPPSAPRLIPISSPAATAIRATWSQHPAGPTSGGDDGQPGPRPGAHPAGKVDHVAALAGQDHRCARGPVAGPAYRYHGALRRQLPGPGGEPAQRDMPGTGRVPGAPLGVLPDVHQDRALVQKLPGLLRAGLGPGREQAAEPAHAVLAAVCPVTRRRPASAARAYPSSTATTSRPAACSRDAAMTARYPDSHLAGALHIPLHELRVRIGEVQRARQVAVGPL